MRCSALARRATSAQLVLVGTSAARVSPCAAAARGARAHAGRARRADDTVPLAAVHGLGPAAVTSGHGRPRGRAFLSRTIAAAQEPGGAPPARRFRRGLRQSFISHESFFQGAARARARRVAASFCHGRGAQVPAAARSRGAQLPAARRHGQPVAGAEGHRHAGRAGVADQADDAPTWCSTRSRPRRSPAADAAGQRARLEDARLAHVHRPQDAGAGRRPDQGHDRAVGQRRHRRAGRRRGRHGRALRRTHERAGQGAGHEEHHATRTPKA